MKIKNQKDNLFINTRWKLDIIAALFVFFILFSFSYVVFSLLTQDIIYQISPVFKNTEIANYVDADTLFNDFKNQTLFLLVVSDIIIFAISMIFFDRMVKKMLKPIEYVSELQKRFASNLSHELRTPLTIMNMRTELLLSKIEKEEVKGGDSDAKFITDIKNGADVIQKEISGVSQIIDDLLFEARIKYAENKVEDISLDNLKKIANKVANNLEHLKNEDVSVIIDGDIDTDLNIKANPLHIERILNNIISNSIKFTHTGEVRISFDKYKSRRREYLRIIIRDTGVGINKKDLPKISDRFYRGKNVENEVSGTGIGLSIVKGIVNDYGWNMNIKSEEGSGTIVEISKILLS